MLLFKVISIGLVTLVFIAILIVLIFYLILPDYRRASGSKSLIPIKINKKLTLFKLKLNRPAAMSSQRSRATVQNSANSNSSLSLLINFSAQLLEGI